MTKINLSRYDHFTGASVVFRHGRTGYLYFVEHSEEWIKQFTSGYSINKIHTINKIRTINIFLIIGGYFLLTNFCRQASITHAEKLVFSFLAWASINSIRSWGKRIPLYVEFLFICLVGIGIHIFSWYLDILHKIIKNIKQKVFKQIIIDIGCYFIISCLNTYISGAFKITIAQRVRTSMDYLTNNIIWSNAMANSNNTLHPKNGQRSKLFKFYDTSTIKNHLPEDNNSGYIDSALAKSKVRIETLNTLLATHDAQSVFFCVSARLFNRIYSMVALMGHPKGWLVSSRASSLNPVNVTSNLEIETSGGDYINNLLEDANMATTPNTLLPKSKLFKFYDTSTATIHEVTANTERQARALLGSNKLIFVARKSLQPQITVSRQWGWYSYE